MMSVSRALKAEILSNNDSEIFYTCRVYEVTPKSATLVIDNDLIDELDSEMKIVFYDETKGLITIECALSASKKFLDHTTSTFKNHLDCYFLKEISSVQRRNEFKLSTSFDFTALFPLSVQLLPDETAVTVTDFGDRHAVAHAKNLSAGGIYFTCDVSLGEGDVIQIILPTSPNERYKIDTEILRAELLKNDPSGKKYGYGCRFVNLSTGVELAIRNFVFKLQLQNRRKF